MEEGKSSDSPLVPEGDPQAQANPSNSEEVHHPEEGHLRDHDYAGRGPNCCTGPNTTNTVVAYSSEKDSESMAPDCPATATPIDQEEYEGHTFVLKLRFPRANRVLMCPIEDKDMYAVVSVLVSNPELGEDPEGAEVLWDHFRIGLGKPKSYCFTSQPNGVGDWSSTKMTELLRTKLEEVRDSIEQEWRLDSIPIPERACDSVDEIHVRREEGAEPGLETGERLESQPHPNQATPTPQGEISSDKDVTTPKIAEHEGGASN